MKIPPFLSPETNSRSLSTPETRHMGRREGAFFLRSFDNLFFFMGNLNHFAKAKRKSHWLLIEMILTHKWLLEKLTIRFYQAEMSIVFQHPSISQRKFLWSSSLQASILLIVHISYSFSVSCLTKINAIFPLFFWCMLFCGNVTDFYTCFLNYPFFPQTFDSIHLTFNCSIVRSS